MNIDHAAEAVRLVIEATNPRRYVTGLNPDDTPPEWEPDPMGPMIAVTVDDAKWDPSPAFLAAQVHALLAVAAELAEANRLTTQAARRQTADCGRQHPGPCAWIDDGTNPPTCLQPEGPTP